jgi:hypothetical protein
MQTDWQANRVPANGRHAMRPAGKTCTENLLPFQDFPRCQSGLVIGEMRMAPRDARYDERRAALPKSWYSPCSRKGKKQQRSFRFRRGAIFFTSFSGSSTQPRRSSPPSSRLIGRRGLETVFYASPRSRAVRGFLASGSARLTGAFALCRGNLFLAHAVAMASQGWAVAGLRFAGTDDKPCRCRAVRQPAKEPD